MRHNRRTKKAVKVEGCIVWEIERLGIKDLASTLELSPHTLSVQQPRPGSSDGNRPSNFEVDAVRKGLLDLVRTAGRRLGEGHRSVATVIGPRGVGAARFSSCSGKYRTPRIDGFHLAQAPGGTRRARSSW